MMAREVWRTFLKMRALWAQFKTAIFFDTKSARDKKLENLAHSRARNVEMSRQGVDEPEKTVWESNNKANDKQVIIFRRPDGGLIQQTRQADRIDERGTKITGYVSTCSYRFLGRDWISESKSAESVARIQKFNKQFERVRAAEIPYDSCVSLGSSDCASSRGHLDKIGAGTMEVWNGLVKQSEFQALAKKVRAKNGGAERESANEATPMRAHRSRDRYRGVSEEDARALRRGALRSQIQDCTASIRRGNPRGCNLGNPDDIMDTIYGDSRRYRGL